VQLQGYDDRHMREAPAQPAAGRVYLILALAVVAISLSAIFIRMAQAPGVVIASYRMVFAALVMLPLALRRGERGRFTGRSVLLALAAGFFLALHFATWISSLSYTSVAASVSLASTTPLWLALLSWLFLGRPPSLAVLFGMLVAVAGGAIIGFDDLRGGGTSAFGNLLALTGAVSMAAYLLLGRSAQLHGLSLPQYAGAAYTAAALLLLSAPALFGYSYTDYPAATFGWILLLALVPQLIGHNGVNYAIKRLNPSVVATATLLEPVGAALLAWLLLAEVPGRITLIGALFLLIGVMITARQSGRENLHIPTRR